MAQQYGNYELIERIARGGMAEVFKARMKGAAGFEKLVALKMLHSHLAEDAEMVASLKDEARLVSNMLHPNICQVLYFEKLGDRYCITMEYIDGKDVASIMRTLRKMRQKLPLEFALYIIRQTLTGLDYAHRMTDPSTNAPLNIIHRDISPQNILVSYAGAVKIIDFGIAKAAEGLHHTQDGVIKGKFRYMAPEQAMGKAIDHRVDIFAAGIVLYEMLLGETHAKGATDAELIIKAQTAQFEPIEHLVPGLPRDLPEILKKALMREPNERFPSARLFRNALDTVVKREGLEVAPEAMAAFLRNLFPDPHIGGSRVDEMEQLAQDVLELSPLPETGQAQVIPHPSAADRSAARSPSTMMPARPASARPAPLPPPNLAPPPVIDFSSPPAPPPPPVTSAPPPPPEAPLPEAHPVGLTRATSESARERRKREREEKKQEKIRQEKVRQEETRQVVPSAFAKPRSPSRLWLFIDRLGKAFVNTLINLFWALVLVAIGASILYFTRSESHSDTTLHNTTEKVEKSCRMGLVEITLKSTPEEADVYFDGELIPQKTPWFNVQLEMCYNIPTKIRVQKGDLFWERKVDYPVKEDGRLFLNVQLSPGGGTPPESTVEPNRPARSSSWRGDSHASGMKVATSSVPSSAMEPPPEPVDLAGGIGILKITCSAPCTVFISGKNKGSEKIFRLRARKDPYEVQADFGGGVLSEPKLVYIYPNQDNFAHFSPP